MALTDGERWIAAQNIERFLAKLDEEQDEGRRQVLRDLIDQERKKLREGKEPEK